MGSRHVQGGACRPVVKGYLSLGVLEMLPTEGLNRIFGAEIVAVGLSHSSLDTWRAEIQPQAVFSHGFFQLKNSRDGLPSPTLMLQFCAHAWIQTLGSPGNPKCKNWPPSWAQIIVKDPITLDEIRKMVGLMLMMGLIRLGKLRDYWSKRLVLVRAPFSSVMTRQRFIAIQACLQVIDRRREEEHIANPEYDGLGAYWKIGECMGGWKERITSMVDSAKFYTLDETGIHSLPQAYWKATVQ